MVIHLNRRSLILGASSLTIAVAQIGWVQVAPAIHVLEDPNCGCCEAWVHILPTEGLAETAETSFGTLLIRHKLDDGVPQEMISCHTGEFDGDEQGDRRHHGGPDKAIHAYPIQSYRMWAADRVPPMSGATEAGMTARDDADLPLFISIQSQVAGGVEVLDVPTALLSNHPLYPTVRGRIPDPDPVAAILGGLLERRPGTPAADILTGFMGRAETASAVAGFVRQVRVINPRLIHACDPVTGDADLGFFGRVRLTRLPCRGGRYGTKRQSTPTPANHGCKRIRMATPPTTRARGKAVPDDR